MKRYDTEDYLKNSGEKCRQKFANLQIYMAFIDNVNQTGSEFKKKPQFFDELYFILGSKDSFGSDMRSTASSSKLSSDDIPESSISQNICINEGEQKEHTSNKFSHKNF